mmetsp:Transcript_48660/g.76857  ORF Transcript_48660/g.76857 Transcript_48660/m.76857 type:complete len:108 (-) Transcript_48660:70-393(-)
MGRNLYATPQVQRGAHQTQLIRSSLNHCVWYVDSEGRMSQIVMSGADTIGKVSARMARCALVVTSRTIPFAAEIALAKGNHQEVLQAHLMRSEEETLLLQCEDASLV